MDSEMEEIWIESNSTIDCRISQKYHECDWIFKLRFEDYILGGCIPNVDFCKQLQYVLETRRNDRFAKIWEIIQAIREYKMPRYSCIENGISMSSVMFCVDMVNDLLRDRRNE